jgi:hypothetical protein
VWESFNAAAKAEELDVTFMLICAAGGFATPWEHLKIMPGQGKDNAGHPAFFNYDEDKYRRSLRVMDQALKTDLEASSLFRQVQFDRCFYGAVDAVADIRDAVESRLVPKLALAEVQARRIVKLLRNAIAHNNLYAFANEKPDVISDLTFFSEVQQDRKDRTKIVSGYEVLVMHVDDFRAFLTAWFALLRMTNRSGKHLKLVVSNALEDEDVRIAAIG